jgi:1-acyl-sn-glycerol-3-phosphate acyltransferase
MPSFSYYLGRLWLGAFGWKVEGNDQGHQKFVVIAAPHTSNWDLPFMLATAYVMRVRASWLGKHTAFRPPLGWLLRKLGGIPVDRRSSHSLVTQMTEQFSTRNDLILAMAPEGTRSKADFWKSGFYQIAVQSGVPIGLGYLDYKRKRGGLGMFVMPTGDINVDMEKIRDFYKNIRGKYPELESIPRLREET